MSARSKIALIDFDDVLFNTGDFISAVREVFVKAGLSKKNYDELYREFREELIRCGRRYHQDEHIFFTKLCFPKIDIDALHSELDRTKMGMGKFVFPDSFGFLDDLGKGGWEKIILTFGDDAWQREKIRLSGLDKMVDRVVVTTDSFKTSAVSEILKEREFPVREIFFVDDNPYQALGAVKSEFPQIFTFQLIRPYLEEEREKHESDYDCRSLKEVSELIFSRK